MPEPWMKFYPRDWASDVQLNQCSLGAREVWLRMIFIMREAEPHGFFVGRSGEAINPAWFAREVNAPLAHVRKHIRELEAQGVFSRDSSGRIYSRRMVQDEARRQQLQENGKQGGNPALLDKPLVNQDGYPNRLSGGLSTTRARNQIPDTRDTDSLRSSAMAFASWPSENGRLRELALIFLAAFGNCFDPLKAEKHLPAYMQVLAQMRSRSVALSAAWQACADALDANNGKPLFSTQIRTAMSFLPARAATAPRPVAPDPYAHLQVVKPKGDVA